MRSHSPLARAVLLATLVLGASAEAQAQAQVDPRQADAAFEALLRPQNAATPTFEAPDVQPWSHDNGQGREASVELTLERFGALWGLARERAKELAERPRVGPAIVLGQARYVGREISGALELEAEIRVTLGRPDQWKTVPLVGEGVVLVAASVDGEAIPVTTQNGYHVWLTRAVGEVKVALKVLVPARGPRGSLEYDFVVPRTPVTQFDCTFPMAGLEPRMDDAIESDVSSGENTTRLTATLRPTTRVHLVGFRDMGADAEQQARVYAETLSLLSLDEGRLELFAVVRYTILYSGAKEFLIEVPPGVEVLDADGKGAFRYTLEQAADGGTLLRGETAVPIRDSYEISLRLEQAVDKEGGNFTAPLPRCRGVERELGWVAVEVPGKLRLDQGSSVHVAAIDARELPPELVRSAVSPILAAYRYHEPARQLELVATRLPEHDVSPAAIDRVRAFSVVADGGHVMTEMRLTMRNRLRHSLAMTLPAGTEVRSVMLDGAPVKPSRDDAGRLLLPLKRSSGGARLAPFTLHVVLASRIEALGGLLGRPDLALPGVDLPASSVAWSVFVPSENAYGELKGDVAAQQLWGRAPWREPIMAEGGGAPAHQPAVDATAEATGGAEGGAMPVRIQLPKGGVRLEYERYWQNAGEPVAVTLPFMKRWLRLPLVFGCLAVMVLAAWWAGRRRRWPWLVGAGLLGGGALFGLMLLTGSAALVVAALLCGAAATHGSGILGRLFREAREALTTLPERYRQRDRARLSSRQLAWQGGVLIAMAVCSLVVLVDGLRLAKLLLSPLL